HPVSVAVARRGVEVRSRRQIMATRAEQRARTRQQIAIEALNSPLLLSALPLRVATFSLLGPETGKVQLLVHADVGTDYSASKAVSLAYILIDRDGRVVESQARDSRLLPIMN